jgi:hypothetical protein
MSTDEKTEKPSKPKTAPVQAQPRGDIPWALHVRAWQVYAALGHGNQSAQRIAERGGFGWLELAVLLAEQNPWHYDDAADRFAEFTPYQRARLNDIRARNADSL